MWRQNALDGTGGGVARDWGQAGWVTLLSAPVNELLMLQVVGPGVGPAGHMEGWAEIRLGPPPQGFIFGDRVE